MRHLDVAERRRRLIVRHHLDRPAATVEQVAADLVGLHSSDPATVVLSSRARLDPFDVADLEDALYERRSLLRLLAMRRTMFVVPLDLAAVMQASCAAALVPAERRKLVDLLVGAGVADDVDAWIARVEAETLAALADRGPTPASQLTKVVPDLGRQLRMAVGKPYEGNVGVSTRLLFLMSTEGTLARARPLGSWISSQYRWVPMADWIGELPVLAAETARAELVRRWLRAYGPGTLDDLAWWTKWTKAHVRAALATVEAVEVTTDVGGDTKVPAWLLARRPRGRRRSRRRRARSTCSRRSTRRSWAGRSATGTSAPTVARCSTATATPDRRCGSAAAPSGHGVSGSEARWSRRCSSRSTGRRDRAIDAEAARLTEWMDGVRVTPRFPTALDRELANS